MTELGAFLLPLVPLLLLVACLMAGFYPGCDAIVRLAKRIDPRQKPAAVSQRRPLPPPSHAASGGLLIALGLAQRPPPLAA